MIIAEKMFLFKRLGWICFLVFVVVSCRVSCCAVAHILYIVELCQ